MSKQFNDWWGTGYAPGEYQAPQYSCFRTSDYLLTDYDTLIRGAYKSRAHGTLAKYVDKFSVGTRFNPEQNQSQLDLSGVRGPTCFSTSLGFKHPIAGKAPTLGVDVCTEAFFDKRYLTKPVAWRARVAGLTLDKDVARPKASALETSFGADLTHGSVAHSHHIRRGSSIEPSKEHSLFNTVSVAVAPGVAVGAEVQTGLSSGEVHDYNFGAQLSRKNSAVLAISTENRLKGVVFSPVLLFGTRRELAVGASLATPTSLWAPHKWAGGLSYTLPAATSLTTVKAKLESTTSKGRSASLALVNNDLAAATIGVSLSAPLDGVRRDVQLGFSLAVGDNHLEADKPSGMLFSGFGAGKCPNCR